jgi:hypothetical protein
MRRFLVALSLVCLTALLTASTAPAEHARPTGETPLNFRLVPQFTQCVGSTPPGMTHGPPLAVPSCNPPVETSNFLTLAAPERPSPYGMKADGTAYAGVKVTCLVPGTTDQVTGSGANPPCTNAGDQIDVKISTAATGVRCVTVSGGCVAAAGLYGGKVLVNWNIRTTDHFNQAIPNPPGADCSDTASCTATSVDLPFDVGVQCTAGACNYTTSMDLTIPGSAPEGKRMVIGLGQTQVQDAGADGNLAGGVACPPTCAQNGSDHNVALTQGVFAP